MKNGIFSISAGAGLLPSTVANTFLNINSCDYDIIDELLFGIFFVHESNPVLPQIMGFSKIGIDPFPRDDTFPGSILNFRGVFRV